MNDKGHLYISLAKSVIRIVGAVIAIGKKSVSILALFLLCAEVLGVAEEVVDKR